MSEVCFGTAGQLFFQTRPKSMEDACEQLDSLILYQTNQTISCRLAGAVGLSPASADIISFWLGPALSTIFGQAFACISDQGPRFR